MFAKLVLEESQLGSGADYFILQGAWMFPTSFIAIPPLEYEISVQVEIVANGWC